MMLDANDLNFAARYPYGAIVRDRWGRRIPGVIACNPETGEVITYGMGWVAHAWHGFLWSGPKRGPLTWRFGQRLLPAGGRLLDRRHGFWPAPLAIEAKQTEYIRVERGYLPTRDDFPLVSARGRCSLTPLTDQRPVSTGAPTLAQLDDLILAVERNP
jgi:hypothetical protein